MENEENEKKSFWMSLKGFFLLLLICVLIFIGGYSGTWIIFKDRPNEAGDTAGLINGLFSALAFAGVIYAIFLQRHELEMQRKELKAQKDEFHMQNQTLKRQRFENTFFNMLHLQQQITDQITFSYSEKKINPHHSVSGGEPFQIEETIVLKGREVFRESFESILHKTETGATYRGMRGLLYAHGIEEYENNFTPSYFDHYFRHLYHIIKFVDTSPLIDESDRKEYTTMVRAQLSRYELIWLYYNGVSSYGVEKFKHLIEKYAMLKNLRTDMLVPNVTIASPYSGKAFGL